MLRRNISIGVVFAAALMLEGCFGLEFQRCNCDHVKSCNCNNAQPQVIVAPPPNATPTTPPQQLK
jgi:hypothetical protein